MAISPSLPPRKSGSAPTPRVSRAEVLIQEFPSTPSANDFIELWEKNQLLQSPEITTFLHKRSAERFPKRP